jgi:hypothetical protein
VRADAGTIAVCGLDCSVCDIRRVPSDAAAAQRVVAWFRDQGWLAQDEGVTAIIQRSMYCKGCRDDRSVHWSPECWILGPCTGRRNAGSCAAAWTRRVWNSATSVRSSPACGFRSGPRVRSTPGPWSAFIL